MQKLDIKKITGIGLLTAIVVVLQMLGSFIRFGPFQISLVLIPIVIGAAMYGIVAGGWLGFVFSVVVLLNGDAALFLAIDVPGTLLTVLIKGTVAGLCAGVVYKLVSKLNQYVGVIVSAIVCPVVNTGIFLLGCYLFFFSTVAEWANGAGFGDNVAAYMFLGLVGGNFLFELLANIVLSPIILRIMNATKRIH